MPAALDDLEVVPANGRDEEGGGRGGGLFVDEILNEIKELSWLIANFLEKAEVGGGVVIRQFRLAGSVALHRAFEEMHKLFVPSHVGITWVPGPDPVNAGGWRLGQRIGIS